MRKISFTKLKHSHKCLIKTIIQKPAAKKLKQLKTMSNPHQKKLAAKKRKVDAEADAKWNEEEIVAESAATEKSKEAKCSCDFDQTSKQNNQDNTTTPKSHVKTVIKLQPTKGVMWMKTMIQDL